MSEVGVGPYEISPDQPNSFLFTAANRSRRLALVGRIREFETEDQVQVVEVVTESELGGEA